MQQIGHLNLNPRHSKSTLLTPVLHSLPLQWELTAQDTQHSARLTTVVPQMFCLFLLFPKSTRKGQKTMTGYKTQKLQQITSLVAPHYEV